MAISRKQKITPAPPTPPQPQPNWLSDFLKENPLKSAWLMLLALGTLSLFSYFYHIEYFPSFDLPTASNVLLALAYVAALLSFAFSVILLAPAAAISMALPQRPRKTQSKRFLPALIQWTACSWLAFLFLGMALASTWHPLIVGCVLVAGLLMATTSMAYRNAKKRLAKYRSAGPHLLAPASRKKRKDTIRKIARRRTIGAPMHAFAIVIMQGLPFTPVLLALSKSSTIAETTNGHLINIDLINIVTALSILLMLAQGGTLYCLMRRPNNRLWLAVIPLVWLLPLLMGFFAQATGMFPMAMAQLTKTGNFRAERVSIASKWCPNVRAITGLACDEKQTAPIILCNAHIMSRIGTETYLRVAANAANKDGLHPVKQLFIPSADVNITQVDFSNKILNLKKIDADLARRSAACTPELDLHLGEAEFEFDGFVLKDAAKTHLAPLLQAIKGAPSRIKEIKVTGHTDLVGKAAHNQWLAAQRATQVRRYLERELENLPRRIPVNDDAKASTEALVSSCMKGNGKRRIACEAPNRRVEIVIIPADLPAEAQ